jgi:hypothetical protein
LLAQFDRAIAFDRKGVDTCHHTSGLGAYCIGRVLPSL